MSVKVTGIADVNRLLGEMAPNEAKNLLRATTFDMAKQAAVIASGHTPNDPSTGAGDLQSSIKAKRERGSKTRVEASVIVTNIKRNFFWRFLEFGDGPDGVEHAMFGKTLEDMRPNIKRIYLETFVKKLTARLKRLKKKAG